MQKHNQKVINFNLNELEEGLTLGIFPEQQSRLRTLDPTTADKFNESAFQLFEGHTYEFEFDGPFKENYTLETRIKGIILPSNRYNYRGRISPNIYVGKLQLLIVNVQTKAEFPLVLEVIATKFNQKEDLSYRENYRKMLEDITDKCTDLMMQVNTPVTQTIAIDYSADSRTIYQRFCFVKSFLDTTEFEEAILRIISNPSTLWKTKETSIKSSQIKRVDRSVMKQLISATNRIDCSDLKYLTEVGLNNIPSRIQSTTKVRSVDTTENRFIKHVLGVFLNFVEDCQSVFRVNKGFDFAHKESSLLIEKISSYISYAFFSEVSEALTLKLNSPLLQKRSGYREVLNRWLQFDLASKLIWQGGEDVYEAGKKDIATLYEYWLFFQLYELIIQKFNLQFFQTQNYEHLFETDETGLSLKLKSGKELIIKGKTNFESRNLTVRFSYNRTFTGGVKYHLGEPGSITTTLRPDYTLSIWPSSFSENEAEKEEVITHIHFDAKYKIQNLRDQYTENVDEHILNRIDERERKGTFKNIDVLKMHTYKDAIRRTGGAYILYPGSNEKCFKGFHEVLPGLGAFSISPSKYDTGINSLSEFLDKVILHLIDRTTQRERINNVSNQILKEPSLAYGKSLKTIPVHLERQKIDILKTYVLVGYSRSQQHLEWCIHNGIYNFRMNDNVGSLELTKEVVQAKYLLLRESGRDVATKLYRITSKGPKVYSNSKLLELGYDNPSQSEYLVVTIEPCTDWNDLEVSFKDLDEYKNINASIYSKPAIPFCVTLDKILKRQI